MCLKIPLRVKSITNNLAVMEDGRRVKLNLIKHVRPGDFLEIYADLALSKIDRQVARLQRGLTTNTA